MSLIEWKSDYLLGNNTIDEQHQHLFILYNKTYSSYIDGNNTIDLFNVIDELYDYVIYHFTAEEKLMIASGYPDYSKHADEHRKFARRISEYKLDLLTRHKPVAEDMIFYLGNWLTNHIAKVDVQYADYLRTSE